MRTGATGADILTLMRHRCVLLPAIVLVLLSCSAAPALKPHSGLIERLRNRGPVALSTENPYLAANLLVSREIEVSPELGGFVKHRGAPAAVEVEKDLFSSLIMHFYYPENREEYELEDVDGTWIIRGPITLSRDKMKQVAALTRTGIGEPKLADEEKENLETRRPESVVAPSPAEAPQQKAPHPGLGEQKPSSEEEDPFVARLEAAERQRRSSVSEPFRSPAAAGEEGHARYRGPEHTGAERPRTGQEEAEFVKDILSVTGPSPAELTPKGDLVHYVTYPGETLSIIARWYTYDRDNAPRIARINRLAKPDVLSLGDQVIIPAYLLKNKNRLPEEGLKAYLKRGF